MSIQSAPGVLLAGTLTTPAGTGPFPAVLLITGSGAQNRDEEIMSHKPFLVIADYLTRHGIAVLRLDDRGTGSSTGQFSTATDDDFVQDSSAAFEWLRRQPGIDSRKVGLIGHSEGALIAVRLANQNRYVAFVVSLAGPAVPLRDLMRAQTEAISKAEKVPEPVRATNLATLEKINNAVVAAGSTDERKAAVAKILVQTGASPTQEAAQLSLVSSPWYAQLIAYDPRPALAHLRVPILALNGSNDLQVLANQNLPAIRAATRKAPNATIVELHGLNHLFQTSATGDPRDYGKIEETFSPTALQLMATWIKKESRRLR